MKWLDLGDDKALNFFMDEFFKYSEFKYKIYDIFKYSFCEFICK